MEQLAKQEQNLTYQNAIETGSSTGKYRRLVLSLLNNLTDAFLEIIDNDEHFVFGDQSATLHGKIIVSDVRFYQDVVLGGSIGAAESYIDGRWNSPNLTDVIQVMARNQHHLDQIESRVQWLSKLKNLFLRRKNINSEDGSKRNILAHYDLGNELYTRFLDPAMQYSCAIYSDKASQLEDAQQLKMKTICERLDLKESDSVVEIGTGWGGLALYMAQNYGCHVTTTTISDAQHDYANQKITELGLTDKVTLLKRDYRKLTGQYDKLVSIEMIEAVGHEYLPTFFRKCSSLLKEDGKMLIQSITIADNRYEKYRKSVDFIQKHVFPGGCLPSVSVMSDQIASNTDMVIHEMHDIGLHYARTLHDWRITFEQRWSEIHGLGYDEEFRRLWLFYLCYCEGAFLQRVISTHHVVARKPRYRGQSDETILDY
ncbi:cyclopropane-fatty-acyl-phospholipid synthase family protein [Vibrio sp. ZSDE26]|uniref:Cyclopropane-fatty-acyl-phospholipid synthase family protein n=1 Tax=Vibrio amylolyticus TaxID=2847292 RepID=A0A9X1XKQ0_9VIBR|nr:cyclopropane-fatty-acyl-phospholipid synthase family protein [Vibrio amylolyticus]MCK6264221.1 cyclopropane-fatty-acyl-phospholipid synthase family protein [Vibrio amylolyticus]